MKSILFIVANLLLSISLLKAQEWKNKYDSVSANSTEGFFMIYKSGKAGFAEEKTGKAIVIPKYDKVDPFSEGVAVVSNKNSSDEYKNGLINKTGTLIVPLTYDNISQMKNGIAIVKLNDKYGYLNKKGKKITPIKYETAAAFSGGMAQVWATNSDNGVTKVGFIDPSGKEVIPVKYDRIFGNKDGIAIAERKEKKYFKVYKTGKETPLNYDKIEYGAFDRLLVEQNKKFGFINAQGKIVIPLIYDNSYGFSSWQRTGNLAWVVFENKCGYIDTSGKEIVPIKYDRAGLFREGLASVTMNNVPAVDSKNGYVDSVGNLVIPMVYNSAAIFSEGMAAVSKKIDGRNFTYGYIDPTGKEIVPLQFEGARDFSEGLAAVKKNGKYGFINKEGREVIPCIYDRVVSDFKEGRASVKLETNTIKIDKEGKEKK